MKRIAFWGTPELTTTYLDALKDSGYIPVVLITNPDRPKGRGRVLTPPPAKVWGQENKIEVLQPEKLDDAFFETLQSYDLDLSVVIAYGSILPKRFIDLPKSGTWNVHYSLLSHYRGASPTEAAILNGDTTTGVSIQQMVEKLDAGAVISQKEISIGEDETTPELRTRLTDLGAELLIETLNSNPTPTPQNESIATYCTKIAKSDGEIDPSGDAEENYNKYRAYKEWPRVFFFKDNKRIIITKAHLEDGRFVIDTVLPEGKKEIPYYLLK